MCVRVNDKKLMSVIDEEVGVENLVEHIHEVHIINAVPTDFTLFIT